VVIDSMECAVPARGRLQAVGRSFRKTHQPANTKHETNRRGECPAKSRIACRGTFPEAEALISRDPTPHAAPCSAG